ncbi:hypothetical protein HK102_002780 [Quaeritorhiza haematococci]|nr:hypothetical protein HK102_002780 [Quaeritorhiza haematococci]
MVRLRDINWVHALLLSITPALWLHGASTVDLKGSTLLFAVVYYYLTGFGITAGYHRYWSHRSYEATLPWQIYLMLAGSGAVEDTDRDPYSAHKGLFWSHIGWMLFKKDPRQYGKVDISDLNRNPLVKWQHANYPWLALLMSFIVPTLVCGVGWGDWLGGFYYAGVARLVFLHHATFCVNSLAHYLGDHTFDDRRSPRDHYITALVTLGEGYHNFHHEFPSDYRNAIAFWQYDPTKWIIWFASLVGLTYDLKQFPPNEIQKGRLQMQQKKIDEMKKKLDWGVPVEKLPKLTWEDFETQVTKNSKSYLIISSIVYDVSTFITHHPGGSAFLKSAIGRDATSSFNGGVYDHSNAARNLMAGLRVAVLDGGIPKGMVNKDE